MHVALSLFGSQRWQQPPNAHPCHAVMITIIFAGIQPLGACFYKSELPFRSWPGDLLSRPTQIILGRAVNLRLDSFSCHGKLSCIRHTAVVISLFYLLFYWLFGCWCLPGAGGIMLEAEAKFTYLCCSWHRLASSVVMVTSGMRVDLRLKARHSFSST